MTSLKNVVSAKFNMFSLPPNQYIREVVKKNQIVLHHTASGKGVDGDWRHWLNTKARIATCVIIDYSGDINQMFSSHFWGYHLGIKSTSLRNYPNSLDNVSLEKNSIAIEIDSWGGLKKINNKWVAWPNDFGKSGKATIIPNEDVIEYPEGFRGFNGFEKYTKEQIETVRQLLTWWELTHGIEIKYNSDIWDMCPRALRGESGVFTHCSYRSDKSDIHPQPELIKMLKSFGNVSA